LNLFRTEFKLIVMAPKKAAQAAAPKAAVKKTTTASKPKAAVAAAPKAAATSKKRKADVVTDGEDAEISKPKKTKVAEPVKKTPATKKMAAPAEPEKKTTKPDDSDKENEGKMAAKTAANTKRKRDETAKAPAAADDSAKKDTKAAAPAKKAKTAAVPKKEVAPKKKVGKKINNAPTDALDVFVFGEGTSGELGLGSVRVDGKKPVDVKRPRLNANLASAKVGVVQVACGGMHVVALTKDNKILTWGVNDQGALGRDTTWDGGLRDAEDEDSDSEDDDDTGMNPKESTPEEIDTTGIDPDVVFVQVVASDSASFALTEDGKVYGWGTFRVSE
jgi:regulator of chromosome condensation